MFIVSKSKWTQKIVSIVFFACKQNLRVPLIRGKELEVFLLMFNHGVIIQKYDPALINQNACVTYLSLMLIQQYENMSGYSTQGYMIKK